MYVKIFNNKYIHTSSAQHNNIIEHCQSKVTNIDYRIIEVILLMTVVEANQ